MSGLCCEIELQAASVDAVVTLLKNDFLTLETLVSFFLFFFLLQIYVYFEIDVIYYTTFLVNELNCSLNIVLIYRLGKWRCI